MNVTIYMRVSCDDKDQNPERQFIRCKQYCDLHSHNVLGRFEEFMSGDTEPITRKVFCKMMELNPEGIIVYSIDRLSRQHPSKIMKMLSHFKDANIKVISVTEPLFNMESDFAEPLQYFLTWWNNYFLKKLKEDVKSGIEKARREGKQIGRPKVKFNQHRAIQLLFNERKSLTEASIELKVSRATLHRFKKVAEKNPSSLINKHTIPKTDVLETNGNHQNK